MSDMPQIQTVKLLFVDVNEQQRAMFRMAFKMHSATNYLIIDEASGEKPDLVIVDGDSVLSSSVFQKAKAQYADSKVVFFGQNPPNITAPYLAKPIKFDSLFVNLRNLLQGNGVHVAKQNMQAATATINHGKTGSSDEVNPVPQGAKAGALKRANETVILRFDPDVGLLGAFRKILADQKDAQIMIGGKPALFVFPAISRVWVGVDSAQLKRLSQQDSLDVKIEQLNDQSLYERANATTTSTLWQLALWTANGRLVRPFKPDTVFRLARWPNLTRLAPLPESLRLSAFLTKTPINLNMLYKLMPSLEMSDIVNYVAATYLTGYLTITQQSQHKDTVASDSSTQATVDTSVALKKEHIQAAKPTREYSGGLLGRLMKKLLK